VTNTLAYHAMLKLRNKFFIAQATGNRNLILQSRLIWLPQVLVQRPKL